ncbi:MAG: FKBP-type peptidyl-prolyl cis-trans isomerase [Methanomassiliicoccus sp.]|nr:FKBP-type peptidyl-prolyl cis-trans isomerase [Methanomassiliicoccus sp.]
MASKSSKPGWLRYKSSLVVVVLVLLVVGGSVGAYELMGSDRTVQSGDLVKVNYIGKLPNGQVFDTSLYSVATDNATYPKALCFSFRGNSSTYTTLSFTVGKDSMIEGFENGVMGMKAGETKTFVITPDEAYGDANTSKITTMNLTETIPVQKTMSVTEFKAYFGESPTKFTLYTDPNYGWTVWTTMVDSSNVVLQNQPVNGTTYKAFDSSTDPSYGWNITAEYDSTGTNIIIHHHLDASSAMTVKGIDSSTTLYVTGVDESAGTAVIDKNNQILGKDLTFTVTVVSIG